MSDGQKRPYAVVLPIADRLLESLSKYCFRIELAGSLRREKAEVGDIEIVAIPIPLNARLDNTIEAPYLLDEWLRQLAEKKLTVIKNGDKYKQFKFRTQKGHEYKVDLFLQPDPATWGTNFMIRTGSADFSHWMVTPRSKGGAVPCNDLGQPIFYCRDARWWEVGGTVLDTPEEEDVFKLLGVEWIHPRERTDGFWHRGENG